MYMKICGCEANRVATLMLFPFFAGPGAPNIRNRARVSFSDLARLEKRLPCTKALVACRLVCLTMKVVEITKGSKVKYELDKKTGLIKVSTNNSMTIVILTPRRKLYSHNTAV